MTYISNRDISLEIAKGNVPKHSTELKFGRNTDVDTGTNEDIWSSGGTFVEPTVGQLHTVVSSSALDTAAGTGARTVFIEGLNSSYAIVTETVTLLGIVPVTTANTYTFINRMYVATFGSCGTNAGTITCSAAVDLTTQAAIAIGFGQTQNAIYMVPIGYKAYLTSMYGSFQQTTANSTLDIMLYSKTFGSGGYRLRRDIHLTNSGNNYFQKTMKPDLQFNARDIIKLRAENASANNCDVGAGFDLILVQD